MMKKKIILALLLLIIVLVGVSVTGCKRDEKSGTLCVNYNVKCALNEEQKVLYVTSEIEVTNESDVSIKELPFYLYPNAYEEEGGGVTIGNVSLYARDQIYNVDGINLLVTLDEELKAGESGVITISSRVALPEGNGRLGYGNGYYNLHAFFPRLAYFDGGSFVVVPYSKIGDPYFFSYDDVTIKIEYPMEYTLAFPGEMISNSESESSKEGTFSLNNARDVAIALIKECETYENEIDGVKIRQYTRGKEDYTNFIKECLAFFSKEIGAYPYSSFALVETPFDYGGMEYSGIVLIKSGAQNKEFIIAHEIIHQWFGLSVGSNSYEECWVDESLTSFLTYYYMDIYNNGGYKESISAEKGYYKKFMEVGKEKYGLGYQPRLDCTLGEFKTMEEYSSMVYGYGVLLYDGIYNVLGEKSFKKAVRNYYSDYAGKVATGEDLMVSFSKSGGKKVEGVFKSYLENKVVF